MCSNREGDLNVGAGRRAIRKFMSVEEAVFIAERSEF